MSETTRTRVGYKLTDSEEPVYSDNEEEENKVELLDEEEQDAVINGLRKQSRSINFVYRILFFTAGLIISLLFFYLSYESEDFGQFTGKRRSQLAHFLTAIGALLTSIRALSDKDTNETLYDEDVDPNSSIISFFSSASAFEKHSNSITTRFSKSFILVVVISVIQFLMWAGPLFDNVRIFGFDAGFKVPLLLFPLILPALAISTEYALYIISTTSSEVENLKEYKYEYKKL
ncbi:nucleolar protein 58 [Acrasis kona]|uniref:Nucleolar protein 58 n=1 Tax=Acrasis kona TaxID=1008807 RepID=A0AAW2ZGA7_9EUKA